MTQDYLSHHGIDGMKWGIRRYQNEDGTRTPLGQRHRREIEGTEGTRESTGSKVKNFVKNNAGTIAKAALATAAVAGTAYLISHNRAAIGSVVKNMSSATMNSINAAKNTVNKGKQYVSKVASKVSSGANKVGTAAKNFHNSKEATAFREQAKKTGKRVADAAKDPKYRKAAGTYAKAYGRGAVELGKKAVKVATKIGTHIGKKIEKKVDKVASGKEPKFVQAKIVAAGVGGIPVIKAVNRIKTEKDVADFARQYKKDYNERQKEKRGR